MLFRWGDHSRRQVVCPRSQSRGCLVWDPISCLPGHSFLPGLPFRFSPKQSLEACVCVCVWGSRGWGVHRGLHDGQGWVLSQPTNSDSRPVFCGGLSVPWKRTEGSGRHSACPQQALHLGLNMGNRSLSKANSRHLPTHTKLLRPAQEPSILPLCLFPEVPLSSSVPLQSF